MPRLRFLVVLLASLSAVQAAGPPDVEPRVTALLARMTLDEKIGQMSQSTSIQPPLSEQIKDEIRTWYRFERPLGEIIPNRRFFFAWKDGCLMGTYNTLEEATDSLTPREMRRTQ